MLANYVIPEFESPQGMLRAKACILCCEYAEFATNLAEQGKQELFDAMLGGVVRALQDKAMPVRVDAATALGAFVESPAAVAKLKPNLSQLLSVLFEMITGAGNEEVIETLGLITEHFKEDMAPYAVQMVTLLAQTFIQMTQEGEDDDDGEQEDSAMAQMGCVRVIHEVLTSVQGIHELWPALEAPLVPLLGQMIAPEGIEFLDEILDIVQALVANAPAISPAMWSLFPRVIAAHSGSAAGAEDGFAYDYLENMLPVIAAYLEKGSDYICNPQCAHDVHGNLHRMIQGILNNDEAAEQDCHAAVWLACALLQHCNGKMDDKIPPYLEIAVTQLKKEVEMDVSQPAGKKDTSGLKRIQFNLIANILVYNPVLGLRLLEQANATTEIFALWFSLMPTYQDAPKREQQTVVLAFSNLFQLGELPASVQAQAPKMMQTIVGLCGILAEEEGEEGEEGRQGGKEDEDEEGGGGFDYDDIDDEEDIQRSTKTYSELDFEAMFGDDGMFGDEDDEIEKLPMDDVNALVVFSTMLQGMQTANPVMFNSLYGTLSAEDKGKIEQIGAVAAQAGLSSIAE